MALSWEEIKSRAIAFSKKWEHGKNEIAEAQSFESDFLSVFGVEDALAVGMFEYKVPITTATDKHRGYFDYFWKKQIAIEMKSAGEDLNKAYKQLKRYLTAIPVEEQSAIIMVCDFQNIVLYRPETNDVIKFKTKQLHKNVRYFANIAGYETVHIRDNQVEVDVKAAEKMAKLHDAFKDTGYDGHDLEVYLVRLLFCLFADDTGIFPKDTFTKYIENSKADGSDLSDRISKLFEVLDMPEDKKATKKLLSDELKDFRYINGGLFEGRLDHADFDAKMRKTLLDCCDFDWSKISPAIFGAMFQGVMNKDRRREIGAHYTSEENILKLLNPLFMDELRAEFEKVKVNEKQLDIFHDKIGKLKFLDPACGCGNFLITTYRELRLLEFEILKMKSNTSQMSIDLSMVLRVTVEQFYGIEIEDFPCQVAQVGMWLIDHQMNVMFSEYFGSYYVRLPLDKAATILNDNALRIDWEEVCGGKPNFIMGNPPYVGARMMSPWQKEDMSVIFQGDKSIGNLDYVAAWCNRATKIMTGTDIKTAFVSTNSIAQGEQVAILWKPIINSGVHINFCYRTFKWSNEAKGKAAVHCVIVGFSHCDVKERFIFDGEQKTSVKKINPYLVEADNVFIENRSNPICDVPKISVGNKPIDGGYYVFSEEEKTEFLKIEPLAEKHFHKFVGAYEFINRTYRYYLWLDDCTPDELRKMPECMKRAEAVRKFRLSSKSVGTVRTADTPTAFHITHIPKSEYLLIPVTSSERRAYIPIGFMGVDIFPSIDTRIIPNATLYHFGVLTSSVHMAWVRAVCGRLKSDYRYSKGIVYNNFIWVDVTDKQRNTIEKAAHDVLDARALYPDSSLADLYDRISMPKELLKAHKVLDKLVEKAYGVAGKNESDVVAVLMERYREKVGE